MLNCPDLLILVSILGDCRSASNFIGPVLAALVVTAMDIYKTLFSSEPDSLGGFREALKTESHEESGSEAS